VYSDIPALVKAGASLNPVTQAWQAGKQLGQTADTRGLASKAGLGELAAAVPLVLPGGSIERAAGRAVKAVKGERLAAAAVRYPNGNIGFGPSHFHALQHGAEGADLAQTAEGFLTDAGRFVDRNEAQGLLGGVGELHSADVPRLTGFGGKKSGVLTAKAGAPLPAPIAPKVDPLESLRRDGLLVADSVVTKLPKKLSRGHMVTEAPTPDAVPVGYEVQGPQGVSGVLKTKVTARRRLDQMDNAHGSYAHRIVPLYAHPRALKWLSTP
jgi:hypothetical protein